MASYAVAYHEFTARIIEILARHFGEDARDILESSPLLGYVNSKARAAMRGAKARGAFANHYALYVLVEDYINKGFLSGVAKTEYSKYEGARFSDLLRRQRELPFGAKLQNHALNSRLNDEFRKFYPTLGKQPVVRDVVNQRYWVQEDLLLVPIRQRTGKDKVYNIAAAIIEIIDAYIAVRQAAFQSFLEACRRIAELEVGQPGEAIEFVRRQLQPNVDARIFEIVSYAVLKAKYGREVVWIGPSKTRVEKVMLALYKTGRTNANDGGIDFVMRPLGRFFQVTEEVDAAKYFLDIDKVQRYPITFVVKTTENDAEVRRAIRAQALERYKIEAVVDSYMNAVEEIINVNDLVRCFAELIEAGFLSIVMEEIVTQSRVEFNFSDDQG